MLTASHSQDRILVLGDQNMDNLEWSRLMHNVQLTPAIEEAEHYSRLQGLKFSAIDHFASNMTNLKVSKHDHAFKSDHKLVTTEVRVNNLNKAKKRQVNKELRTKTMNPEEYAKILNTTCWPNVPFIQAMKKKKKTVEIIAVNRHEHIHNGKDVLANSMKAKLQRAQDLVD